MELTKEQQEIYDGKKGEVLSKVMKSLVLYGENFGATKMVPVTSKYGHIVTSFGVIVIKGVFELMDQLINAGLKSKQLFTADPRPIDPHVPANLLQKIVFKVMYGEQKRYEQQLSELGLLSKNSFSCASYLKEVGNTPKEGEILSWAESSAVNYVNSVLGARCNRNSGIMELFGSILGFVPYFGLLTDEGRKADWIIEVKTSKLPEPQLLGSAIGMKVVEDVPYVKGLDKYLNPKMDDDTVIYLKDFGAAAASNGAVGLYHIDGITPEAKKLKTKLIKPNAKTYVITDEELEKVLNQEKILKPLIINDKYPIYTLLNYLNNSSSIYLQKEYGILNQDELKESIKNYSKTIIASKELISYLKELDLIKEEYTLNKNEYLIVDKYQNNIKKAIK